MRCVLGDSRQLAQASAASACVSVRTAVGSRSAGGKAANFGEVLHIKTHYVEESAKRRLYYYVPSASNYRAQAKHKHLRSWMCTLATFSFFLAVSRESSKLSDKVILRHRRRKPTKTSIKKYSQLYLPLHAERIFSNRWSDKAPVLHPLSSFRARKASCDWRDWERHLSNLVTQVG